MSVDEKYIKLEESVDWLCTPYLDALTSALEVACSEAGLSALAFRAPSFASTRAWKSMRMRARAS